MFLTVHISLIISVDVFLFPTKNHLWLRDLIHPNTTSCDIHIYSRHSDIYVVLREKLKTSQNQNQTIKISKTILYCENYFFNVQIFKSFDQVPTINSPFHIVFCIASFTHFEQLLLYQNFFVWLYWPIHFLTRKYILNFS